MRPVGSREAAPHWLLTALELQSLSLLPHPSLPSPAKQQHPSSVFKLLSPLSKKTYKSSCKPRKTAKFVCPWKQVVIRGERQKEPKTPKEKNIHCPLSIIWKLEKLGNKMLFSQSLCEDLVVCFVFLLSSPQIKKLLMQEHTYHQGKNTILMSWGSLSLT